MAEILDLVKRLYPFPYSVTGKGNDDSLPVWLAELPFEVSEYPSGAEYNGWTIPPAWEVKRAEIRKHGKLVYDGTGSPLGVVTLSRSFSGRVGLGELKEKVFYSEDDAEAVVYHWGALYRPIREDYWGFCMPRRLAEGLTGGDYDVHLETEERAGTMKVLDHHLPGRDKRTVLLHAHNCHPFQANDDISGCAVGIAVMKRLAGIEGRRLSYRLLIAPELYGTMFWLDGLGDRARDIACTIKLASVGNDRDLRLQESFTGDSDVDRAARHVLGRRLGDFDGGPFRSIHGNDETVFEAPGFEIPSICLTRWPFEQYHTDQDTPEALSEERLSDAADAAFETCMALEYDITPESRVKGLVRLSDPRYDLYKPAPAPGIDKGGHSEEMARWNWLMNCLPRLMDGRTGLIEIADRFQLPVAQVHDYVMQWVDRGLARVVESPATGAPDRGAD